MVCRAADRWFHPLTMDLRRIPLVEAFAGITRPGSWLVWLRSVLLRGDTYRVATNDLTGGARPVVILDANALRRDFFFRSNAYRVMLWEAREGRLRIVIPEVVIDEVLNLYREAVASQQITIRNALRELEVLQATEGLDEQQLDVTAAAVAFEAHLRNVIDYAGIQVAPYPSVSHEEVVKRALDRSPPFSPDGKDGYRDTLLWETAKQLVRDEPQEEFVLISADARAFSPKDSPEMHPTLIAEIEELAYPLRLSRIADIRAFTERYVPNVDELLVEVTHRLATEPEFKDQLTGQIIG